MDMDLEKLNKNRIPINDVFSSKKKEVEVAGWVHNSRELGKIRFLLIRDFTGIVQVTAVKGRIQDNVFAMMEKPTRESIVYVKGTLVVSKQAPGGKEIVPHEIVLLNKADDLPIDIPLDLNAETTTELPKRLDYRFLDFHRKKSQAIFKIQNTISNSFREFFYKKGFLEMQPPGIIEQASEGGTDLFEVKYFENQFSIMKHLEEAIKFIVKRIIENNKDDLELLKIKLKVPKGIYLSYEGAMNKIKGKIGEDFTPEQERKLCAMYRGDIVFVHSWPATLKPFYIMPKDEKSDAKLSEGFDALYGGVEVCSGGQRIHLPELLVEMIKKKNLNPKNFKAYIDSFRYGAPPHAGWSLGLERMTQVICGLDNIKEATMFPRDRDRLSP